LKDYLVILAGSPRGGEQTWTSLYKYVVDFLDADLAICCSDKWNQDISLFQNADYKWIFPEFDNYFDYYDSNFDGSWMKYFETGKDTGLYSSGSVHFVFKDIILKNYLKILNSYQYIIYTRFDQKYTDYHPKGLQNKILIPKGEDYFGICDRHALFPSEFSEEFLDICNYINKESSLNPKDNFNNCETTFKRHLISNNIFKNVVRFDRSQFTTSLKGEHTNWRIAKYKLYLFKKLMIKYPDEFISSMKNLISKKGLLYVFNNELRLLINYIYLISRRVLGKLKNKNV
tara:strand:+ start:3755 stop:4615 length:861 start_codon:yes stop_codon:yes gene_type:complete